MTDRLIAEGGHLDFDKLNKRLQNIVKNTKKFNGGLITTKKEKSATAIKVSIFYKKTNKLLRRLVLVHDRCGWDLHVEDYPENR